MLDQKLISLLKKNKRYISRSKIICIGDIILDHYISGKVDRISPEAPVPILIMENQKYEIGGVGNVAKNIAALKVAKLLKIKTIGITGSDASSFNGHCDVIISVPASRPDRIQEMHIAIGHIICEILESELC